MVTGSSQPAADLAVTRLPSGSMIFLGIRNGGRVRLTAVQARQLAGSLLELAEAPDGS